MNIAEQMEQIGKLIRHGLPEDITLSVTASEEDLFVEVDPSQLDNALVNLAMNARDAMSEGGLLTLETRMRTQPWRGQRQVTQHRIARRTELRVAF